MRGTIRVFILSKVKCITTSTLQFGMAHNKGNLQTFTEILVIAMDLLFVRAGVCMCVRVSDCVEVHELFTYRICLLFTRRACVILRLVWRLQDDMVDR